LVIDGCGYVIHGTGWGLIETTPLYGSYASVYSYFSLDGVRLGTRFHFGGVGVAEQRATTDGVEVVAARKMLGTVYQPVSIGSQAAVVRLAKNGDMKWYSVLKETGAIWSALAVSGTLMLPSGLTVVSTSVNGFFAKLFVLDPNGCVLEVYAFGKEYVSDPNSPYHVGEMYDLVRMTDGRFAAHNKIRIYFFTLPIVEEWEAANAPPP
jgi:hypothetical protein